MTQISSDGPGAGAAPDLEKRKLTLRGAIFIGIGSMVGAGIFALFGEAGAIAGAAVWVSFLVGGVIALLQGYSFAKLGARYPSVGGIASWIVRGYGAGLFAGGIMMLGYFSYIIVTAMVAVPFGNYASELFVGDGAAPIWTKIFAAGMVILLTFVNSIGAETVSKAQTAIVGVVLVVLTGFAVAMLVQLDRSLLAPAGYPPMSSILASVAILLFAWHTLKTAPETFAILVAIIVLAWVVEAIWRGISKRKLEVNEQA